MKSVLVLYYSHGGHTAEAFAAAREAAGILVGAAVIAVVG